MGSLEAFAAQLPQLEVLAEQLYTATVSSSIRPRFGGEEGPPRGFEPAGCDHTDQC